ncbi:MAG TPA: hypothetical protein PLI09_09725 [Candidatus Hydrogenedentes bacterium]|nr:hypothetical protein [Candidatus Hydrogenedentota bacterium]
MKGKRYFWVAMAAFVIVASVFGNGCATNRGILDIQVAESPNPAPAQAGANVQEHPSLPYGSSVENLPSGNVIAIVRVTDNRKFELAPRNPSVPSLRGREVEDKMITSRAIARKRNSYGMAMGDILLPEGRTVENVVREALTKAFREAGYSVLDSTSAPNASAMPVEADIEQFWSWFTPGFATISVEFEARVKIKGNIQPFTNGETVRGYVKHHAAAAGTRQWQNAFDTGVAAFIDEVKKRLAAK